MVDRERFGRALATALLRSKSKDAVAAICEACVAFLPATGAGVTVMVSVNTQQPVHATDLVATRLDAAQFALGEGPCVDAFRSGQPVLVADVAAGEEVRWPAFAAAIGDTPVRGMYVFPLRVGARRLGVLNVYRDRPGVLGPAELAAALRATDSVVLALLESGMEENTPMGTETHGAAPHMYRAEVHQATGMITEQAGIDAASALARLRAAAFTAGRSIDELALDVVTRRVRFEPDGAAPLEGDGT